MWNTSGPCKQLFVCVTLAVFIIIGYFAILRNDQISVVGGYLMDYNSNYEPSNSTYSQEYNLNSTGTKSMVVSATVETILPEQLLPPIPHNSRPSDGGLARPMTDKDYSTYRRLLGLMANTFDRNNITYILSDGTLMGSYLYHDFLPWDDDLDIRVSYKDYPKLKKVVYQNPHLRKYVTIQGWGDVIGNEFGDKEIDKIYPDVVTSSPKDKKQSKRYLYHRHKWFFTNQTKTFNYPWRWPFIDIFFMKENSTHAWTLDLNRFTFYFKLTDIYPLHLRPFAGMWLPAPRLTKLFLQKKYKQFKCRSHTWSHVKEDGKKRNEKPCASFNSVYPYVKRSRHDAGTMEKLILGDETLYQAYVDEPYIAKQESFSIS